MTGKLQDHENKIAGEAKIISFIVQVWREEATAEKRQAIWRGFIYSISNGESLYFSNVKKILHSLLLT